MKQPPELSSGAAAGPGVIGETGDIRRLVSFRLSALAHLTDQIGQRWLTREHGLRVLEWRCLGLVAAQSPARFSDLVGQLHVDKGQLSRVVTGLAARGLVQADADPDDRRGKVLTLSPEGRVLFDRILPQVVARNERMLGGLTADEARQLSLLLDKLRPLMDARFALGD